MKKKRIMADSSFLADYLRTDRSPSQVRTELEAKGHDVCIPDKPPKAFIEIATKPLADGGFGLTSAQAEEKYESIRDLYPDRLDYSPEIAEKWGPEYGNKHIMEYVLAKEHGVDEVLTNEPGKEKYHAIPTLASDSVASGFDFQSKVNEGQDLMPTTAELWKANDVEQEHQVQQAKESALTVDKERTLDPTEENVRELDDED